MLSLFEYDQLKREQQRNHAFAGFQEGPIMFPPTYKYDKGSNRFDTSAKARIPAWTDRVLYRMAASKGKVSDAAGRAVVHAATASIADVNDGLVVTSDDTDIMSDILNHNRNKVDNDLSEGSTTAVRIIDESTSGCGTTTSTTTTPTSQPQQLKSVQRPRVLPPSPRRMLTLKSYGAVDVRCSDHRPVYATFDLNLN